MPLTNDEIRSLLSDIEDVRVKRTLVTDNTKKRSEAIHELTMNVDNVTNSETIVTNDVSNDVDIRPKRSCN